MRLSIVLKMLCMVLLFGLALPWPTPAAVVGHITQIEGRVDLLKGGKLPANPVKTGDAVEIGDVLRSKSLSKAQITFIDNSLVTISPESRLAIEDYQIEPAQGKRHAVLELFQGLAHVVVSQIFKVKEPDFLIKTHTAITGVRGTDFGVRLYPNSSTILNFKGKTQVGNVFPEVTSSLIRAQKIAYGSAGGGLFPPGSFVMLGDMQTTTVQRNLPPTLPASISAEDQVMFMHQMAAGLLGKRNTSSGGSGGGEGGGGGGAGTLANATSPGETPTTPAPSNLGTLPGLGAGNTTLAILNTVTVPPTLVQQTQPTGGTTPTPTTTPIPTPTQYTFTQSILPLSLSYSMTQISPTPPALSAANLVNTTAGTGTLTGVYANTFSTSFNILASSPQANTFPASSTGSFLSVTGAGTITGTLGSPLTGTMNVVAKTSGGTTLNLSGPVTVQPNGNLTFTPNGNFTTGGVTGTTGGTWTQTKKP